MGLEFARGHADPEADPFAPSCRHCGNVARVRYCVICGCPLAAPLNVPVRDMVVRYGRRCGKTRMQQVAVLAWQELMFGVSVTDVQFDTLVVEGVGDEK